MRTGNPADGMYFFLLVIPFFLSLWTGDLVRRKLLAHLVLENCVGHGLSSAIAILAEALVIITGIAAGFALVRFI